MNAQQHSCSSHSRKELKWCHANVLPWGPCRPGPEWIWKDVKPAAGGNFFPVPSWEDVLSPAGSCWLEKKSGSRPSPQPLKVAGSTDHLAHDTHTSSLQAIAPSLSRASAPQGLQRCIFRSKHRFRGGSGTMGVWYPSPLPLCAKKVENGKPRKGPGAVRGLPGTSLPWGRHRGSRAKVQAQNAPFWPSGAKGARVPLFLARWQPRG